MAQCAKWRFLIENEQLPSLHKSVYDGNIDHTQDLLKIIGTEKHGTLNEICENMTPLDIAVAIQNEDMVELLLAQPGIEVNLQQGSETFSIKRFLFHFMNKISCADFFC